MEKFERNDALEAIDSDMGCWFRRFGVLMAVIVWGISLHGQTTSGELRMPAVQGTSFSGQAVDLPKDLQGRVGVLVVGFSQGSRDSLKGWGLKLGADYSGSANVMFYEMPVLASVPRLLRGYVAGKIKDSIADPVKRHFVAIMENEAAWRAVTSYKGGDDAYVLVVDGQGTVRWQTHGAVSDDAYKRLVEHIATVHSTTQHTK